LFYKWFFGIPYVVTEHWTEYMDERIKYVNWLKKWLTKIIINHSSFVCPVSETLKIGMNNLAPTGNYIVVPNVVDTSLFVSLKKQNEKFKFVHISSLFDEQKNISGLLNGVKKLTLLDTNFSFHIISCSQIEDFLNMATNLGLNEVVHFHKSFSPQQVANFLSGCDCFVLFSHFESFGVVIIEAFAAGLPVISTPVGAASELINLLTGILVPNNDVDALAKSMKEMIDHYYRFQPNEIRKIATEHYSYKAIGEQFNSIYLQTVNRNNT